MNGKFVFFQETAVAYLHKTGFCLYSTLFHGTPSRDIHPANSSVTDLLHTSLCTFSFIELSAGKDTFFLMWKKKYLFRLVREDKLHEYTI